MTALVLYLLGGALLLLGGALTWPLAYRAGVSAQRYRGRHRLGWWAELNTPRRELRTATVGAPRARFAYVTLSASYWQQRELVAAQWALPVGQTYGQPRELVAA